MISLFLLLNLLNRSPWQSPAAVSEGEQEPLVAAVGVDVRESAAGNDGSSIGRNIHEPEIDNICACGNASKLYRRGLTNARLFAYRLRRRRRRAGVSNGSVGGVAAV